MSQPLVKADTALNSLRDSDFDCYSAYAEAIDNSLQAGANRISVEFKEKKLKAGANSVVGEVVFCDNGSGMDKSLLHKCLTLGMSSRYGDRSGIGRFGVGMTLGAIHEAKRVEVYSKIVGGEWLWTYMDLDEISDGTMRELPEPIVKSPEKVMLAHHRDESGTFVVWRKCDRAKDNYASVVEESRFYFGRVFRRFIWGTAKSYEQVEIKINGQEVKAFDPLFVTTEKTLFPADEPAELFPVHIIPWKVPNPIKQGKTTSNVVLNMSLVHPDLRPHQGFGGSEKAMSRLLHRNEGLSILRNDREVFFGHIPRSGMFSGEADSNKSRYIGIEISFDAVLDSEFSVKNIKRGAIPVGDLKKKITAAAKPTIKTCFNKISDLWEKTKREELTDQEEQDAGSGLSGARAHTNRKLAENKEKLRPGRVNVNKKTDEEVAEKLADKPNITKEEVKKMVERLKTNGIVVEERQWPGNIFMEMEHANSFKTLVYNTSSSFHRTYQEIFDNLSRDNRGVAEQYQLLVDLIFISYMLAESDLPDGKHETGYLQDTLKNYWSSRMSELMQYVLK
jgi:hypothetical protein